MTRTLNEVLLMLTQGRWGTPGCINSTGRLASRSAVVYRHTRLVHYNVKVIAADTRSRLHLSLSSPAFQSFTGRIFTKEWDFLLLNERDRNLFELGRV